MTYSNQTKICSWPRSNNIQFQYKLYLLFNIRKHKIENGEFVELRCRRFFSCLKSLLTFWLKSTTKISFFSTLAKYWNTLVQCCAVHFSCTNSIILRFQFYHHSLFKWIFWHQHMDVWACSSLSPHFNIYWFWTSHKLLHNVSLWLQRRWVLGVAHFPPAYIFSDLSLAWSCYIMCNTWYMSNRLDPKTAQNAFM